VAAVLAGDWVPHDNPAPAVIDEDGEAVAAAAEVPAVVTFAAPWHGEPSGGDAIGRAQGRAEDVPSANVSREEAQQRRLPVALAEAAEELRVGEDAAPSRADEGRARERGRLRREAE
jgi:hypothetical protein